MQGQGHPAEVAAILSACAAWAGQVATASSFTSPPPAAFTRAGWCARMPAPRPVRAPIGRTRRTPIPAAARRLVHPEADALAGKLDFVSLSSGAYRVGRTAIRALRIFRDALRRGGPGGSIFSPGIPEYLQEAMRFLIVLLPRLPPATYYMRRSPVVPPIVVYADAAFEPDEPRPAGLGAC
eukprot:scaffold11475_cov133-Isochrysis_galbana.AAC.4